VRIRPGCRDVAIYLPLDREPSGIMVFTSREASS
jgi:hypothetical protein